ncbi:YheV family putative zinc ribbon protein [Lonsdalea quercina]|uniref:YheV family putative zinc ribbon protein n=1 Tax=Lonsdalea quercina TaxID=71657 RepID=UPI00397682EC
MSTQRKRFIAGAVCPECHTQDTLTVGMEDVEEVVVCVKCGYRQSRPEAKQQNAERQAGHIIGMFHPE